MIYSCRTAIGCGAAIISLKVAIMNIEDHFVFVTFAYLNQVTVHLLVQLSDVLPLSYPVKKLMDQGKQVFVLY